jgi:hypothetical protein
MKRSERRSSSSNKSFFFHSPTPFFFYPFPPLPGLFHPSYLHSLFLPVPFSPSLISLHPFHICSIVALLIAHSAPSFLSFHPIRVFSLLVLTSKSRHHFLSFALSLPQVLRNFLSYTSHISCCIWIL